MLKRLMSYFPTKLPVGVTEFDKWADSILDLSGRYAKEDDMKWALANMVIHADSKFGALPKNYFVNRLRKAAANQIASNVFQTIKLKQEAEKAAQTEAAKLTQAEATAAETANQSEQAPAN